MRLYEDLFWVRVEWEGQIDFTVLDNQEDLYNYYDRGSFGELLRYTPPATPGEWIRDLFEVNLSFETVRWLGAIRSRFRRMLRWLVK